jgi:Glycosyltransferase sugar-binding region containing DXD motif
MNAPDLPPCRHRGPQISPGLWTCSSPKLITPAGIVESDVCRHECPYVDHDDEPGLSSGTEGTELLGHLTVKPRPFESAPVAVVPKSGLLSIAMITAPRPARTVERSLTELRRAGFLQTIHVFEEPETDVAPRDGIVVETNPARRGLWGNWLHAARSMGRRTDSPFVLICEDDIQLSACTALALQHAIETCPADDWGYASLYTPFFNVRNRTISLGWQPLDLGERSWGALAYCFSRDSLERLLDSDVVRGHAGPRDTDAVVSLAMRRLRRTCWIHVPSLCAHTGTGISSMGHEGRQEFAAVGFKPDYARYREPSQVEDRPTSRTLSASGTLCAVGLDDSPTTIPKIIHQVWIGEHPPPRECLESWRALHPDWEHRLWTDGTAASLDGCDAANVCRIEFPLRNQHLFDATPNFSGKVNVLRYEILEQHGGVYVDADMLCLKPLPDDITSNRLVSVYEDELGSPGLINNCLLGAPAGSPILRELIADLHAKTADDVSRIPSWRITGPQALTAILQPHLGRPDVTIYPSRYFVPIHFSRELSATRPLHQALAVHLFGSTANAAAPLEYLRRSFLKGGARPAGRPRRKRLRDLTVVVQSSFVPSHPSTEMIERSIASLCRLGEGFRLLTAFDGCRAEAHDRRKYLDYKQRARQRLPGEFLEMTQWGHSGGTLPPTLERIETPFLLYWEHDWELSADVDVEGILAALDEHDDVRFIRLNKRRNETQASDRELRQRPGLSPVPLVITPSWSANPHFSTATVFRNFVLPRSRPGELLETPLFHESQDDYQRLGLDAHYAKWGNCIYGCLGDGPTVRHLDGEEYAVLAAGQIARRDVAGNVYPRCDCPIESACGCTPLSSYERAYRLVLQAAQPRKVFEWGPGLNTRMALAAGAAVTSYEFSERWLPTFSDPRLTVVQVSVEGQGWVDLGKNADADVFFIDSRRRSDCLDAVFHAAKTTALACLHDAQRRRYHEALARFPFVWFIEPGFALASRSLDRLEQVRAALDSQAHVAGGPDA